MENLNLILSLVKWVSIMLLVLTVAIFVARLVFALPKRTEVASSVALTAPVDGALAESLQPIVSQHPGKSGVMALPHGTGAFAARVLLARAAKRSIDAQYYIWHDDLTGILLLHELRKAAGRGVRVRLLIDDNGIAGMDAMLVDLSAHPNFEVRLFNPFMLRNPKWLNYGFDFSRLNHRMHNKSFTVDNLATVVGGRNVGDEYFGTGPNPLYIDFDVLTVGEIVSDVSEDFDRYWNSATVYPAGMILDPLPESSDPLGQAFDQVSQDSQIQTYLEAIRQSTIVQSLANQTLDFEWVDVRLVSDDPTKAQGRASREQLLMSQLREVTGSPKSRLDLVSPYFVPGKRATQRFVDMERDGIDVRIVTNSLEATDVAAVHAGYAKYRKDLLTSGVELFELKSFAAPRDRSDDLGVMGSSSSSLHAKIFAVDQKQIYVGSFNFDPRAMFLNTEMGFVIESAGLVQKVRDAFSQEASRIFYHPVLSQDELVWKEQGANGIVVHSEEPGSSFAKRLIVTVVSWLPVEWLL